MFTTTAERDMLADERRELLDRLTRVDRDAYMLTLERSAERRAIRARLLEIDVELRLDRSRISAVHNSLWGR